jgi:hypothetical protein
MTGVRGFMNNRRDGRSGATLAATMSFRLTGRNRRSRKMRTVSILLLSTLVLAGCGTTTQDRSLSGAGIGAGVGLLAGPPGALVGGAIGAGVGAATQSDDVYLGEPVWRQ